MAVHRHRHGPDDALEVYVVGKQWMWKVQHPDGQREINELHVPVGRPVKLTMTSRGRDPHFFVPAFRIKQDVLPGRYTYDLVPGRRSRAATTCSAPSTAAPNHCRHGRLGRRHGAGRVPALAAQRAPTARWRCEGRQAVPEATSASPATAPTRRPAPRSWRACTAGTVDAATTARTVVADEAYIRESILNPSAKVVAGYEPIMPTFQGQVSEEELLS